MQLTALIVGAALGLSAPLATDRTGQGDMNAVHAIGEAIAFQKACPRVAVNQEFIARSMARAGISLAPLLPKIRQHQPYHAMRLEGLPRRDACELARRLYGGEGSVAAGYLIDLR